SFVYLKDQKVVVPDLGEIKFDIAFGGAFYAVVDATALDLVLTGADFNKHVDYGRKIKQAVLDNFEIRHPVEEELSSLFGVIFTGAAFDDRHHSRNVTVFEDGEVDRSPTGSGISARVALLYERGELAIGETITIESILGSTMTVAVAREEAFEGYSAIIPTVSGSAYIMGVNEILFDPKDPFNEGFIFR
ncbi:MAG: proline racemase family protein, partial [Pseudomonadales bacterium]